MDHRVRPVRRAGELRARDLHNCRATAISHRSCRAGRRLAILAAFAFAASSAPAVAVVPDPERDATAQTGWHWYHGLTAAQVQQRLAADRDRIVDVEVQSTSPYRFAVATVRNEGAYKREWYWYYGLTAGQVAAKLKEKTGRLIDLETYLAAGARRFAVVMVANSGEAAKNWHWYHRLDGRQLSTRLRQHRSRLVDLESYSVGGRTKYAAVMIRNSGVDKAAWWYWRNVPLSKVENSAGGNGARTFSLDRLSNGRYNAIQVKRKSEFSDFKADVDERRLGDFVSQNGGRIVDIDAYTVGGQRRFTVIVNDNADAFNARVRRIARESKRMRDGRFGMFVKQVGGPVSVSLGADRAFEPASVMKILHHLYLHTRLEANPPENLDAIVQVPADVCPMGQSMAGSMTLDEADRKMMALSDNPATFAIERRYGRATLNAFARSIGATSTQINHALGCWDNDSTTTLLDLSRMIEGASGGSLLPTESVRNRFFDTLIQSQSVGPELAAVISEEAGLAGKPQIAQDFTNNVVVRGKGGGYGLHGRVAGAGFGRILIPFKVDGQLQQRAFAFGHFYNCEACRDAATTVEPAFRWASAETFRAAVRAAVATW